MVKSFACCTGGPGSIPGRGTQNFQLAFISKISASMSIACDIKPKGALYSVFNADTLLRQVKYPTVGNREYLVVDSHNISSLRLPLAPAHISSFET